MGESESAAFKAAAEIPYFFYDIIARITPGAFLIIGVILSWKETAALCPLQGLLDSAKSGDVSAGVATLLVGTSFVIFLSVSAFLGFLIASLSNVAIEQTMFGKWPHTTEGLREYLGVQNLDSLKTQFKARFGLDFKDDSLNKASFLCAYDVWRADRNLGAMTGRHDAESLAAQSLLLVSVALILAVIVKGAVWGFDGFLWIWLGALILVSLAAWLTFKYHRKKRVYSRYALFLAANKSPL